MKKIILLRHGESQWNLENRFTGWTDVELTDKGREEARRAGRLLKDSGIKPGYMFTSVLRRAIHTLQIAAEEMELDWVPVFKDWHLNERHYGALQGLNKTATAEKFGFETVHEWRRSFDALPPLLSRDDPRFPGHDPRYAQLSYDELPVAESLQDTIARVRCCWEERILPELRRCDAVMVVAHGNSLRGIVKQLKGISDSDIAGLELPTAAPWVFEFDDGMRLVHDYMPGNPDELARRMAAVAAQGRN